MQGLKEQDWDNIRKASDNFLIAYNLDPSNEEVKRNHAVACCGKPGLVFKVDPQTQITPKPQQFTSVLEPVLNSLDKNSTENAETIRSLMSLKNNPEVLANHFVNADKSPRPLTRFCG